MAEVNTCIKNALALLGEAEGISDTAYNGIIRNTLIELKDAKYRDFQCRLMPTVNPQTVIGVRTPLVRAFAAGLNKLGGCERFLRVLPHGYYEENNLHGFIIEGIKDYGTCVQELDLFLPYVDNWATCDTMRPKVFAKHLKELSEKTVEWIQSGDTYTVRFAIEMLMTFYLDKEYSPEYPGIVAAVNSDEYYVKMMVAWYFATALAKQYDDILPYFEDKQLDTVTHNMAIRKAIESRRITEEQKKFLRTLAK